MIRIHNVAVEIFALVVLTTPAAPAQTDGATADVPRLGYVFDSSAAALRLASGIPGAATFGPALGGNPPMLDAAVSPLQNYALFTSAPDAIPTILKLGSSAARILSIDGIKAGKTMVLSPAGKAALIGSMDLTSVQVLTGLPDQASASAPINISGLPGQLEAMAISDQGSAVISVASDQAGSTVYLLDSSGNLAPRLLATAGQVSAMAFFPNLQDALVADRAGHQILLIKDAGGQAGVSIFASDPVILSDPIAIAISADSRVAIVANAGTKSILSMDAATASVVASFQCSCTPSGLHRMLGNAVFRLTDDVTQPMWILDGDASQPRIAFIPAITSGTGGANGQ